MKKIDTEEFHKKVLDRVTNNITDRLFLMIQNDRELMQDYLNLLEGKIRKNVNAEIAKAIKDRFELQNKNKSDKPESTLIKTYTTFKK